MSPDKTCRRCGDTYPHGGYHDHKLLPSHLQTLKGANEYSRAWGITHRKKMERGPTSTILALHDAGMTSAAIARQLNVSRQWTSYVLVRAGRRSQKRGSKHMWCFLCDTHYQAWRDHQASEQHQLTNAEFTERLAQFLEDNRE